MKIKFEICWSKKLSDGVGRGSNIGFLFPPK
jgi:hypothetical protein